MLEDQAGPFSVLTVSFLGWVSGCPGSGMRLVCISRHPLVCATIGASPNPLALPYARRQVPQYSTLGGQWWRRVQMWAPASQRGWILALPWVPGQGRPIFTSNPKLSTEKAPTCSAGTGFLSVKESRPHWWKCKSGIENPDTRMLAYLWLGACFTGSMGGTGADTCLANATRFTPLFTQIQIQIHFTKIQIQIQIGNTSPNMCLANATRFTPLFTQIQIQIQIQIHFTKIQIQIQIGNTSPNMCLANATGFTPLF